MVITRFSLGLVVIALTLACSKTGERQTEVPSKIEAAVADSFAYPVGRKEFITQTKDTDEWYNALDFGRDDHLGEDWNRNTGGNTDCGEPVYAVANGVITFAKDVGPGWGNAIIIEHLLSDGKKVQSLYGHLQEVLKTSGEVKKREQIGTIGSANGRYLCHLHLEIREESCPMWDHAGPGYSTERGGWLDPSDFIDSRSHQSHP